MCGLIKKAPVSVLLNVRAVSCAELQVPVHVPVGNASCVYGSISVYDYVHVARRVVARATCSQPADF